MSIASEITALNTNLQNAKSAVTTKGGTVGDTGLAGLASEIATIPSGGGSRPATWADFKAMTLTQMHAVYGVGDRVGLACPFQNSSDLLWEIVNFGTTRLEGDTTDRPCVTLVARLYPYPGSTMPFDAAETPTAATEETAQAGIYYFGFDGSSYTALNLTAGDTIPYGDYMAVYKTDVTDDVSYYNAIRQSGYNNYHFSAARQWLNSDGVAGAWWSASHVGDVAPSQAASVAGFMAGLPADFKAILSRTEVKTTGNNVTDGGTIYTDYDYFFLPSLYEIYADSTPVDGDRMPYFAVDGSAKNGLRVRGSVRDGSTGFWWTRSCSLEGARNVYHVDRNGSTSTIGAYSTYYLLPACKIVLAGA